MANELNELDESLENKNGRDVHVIEKQIAPKTGAGSVVFEVLLWVCGIIPGAIFLYSKIKAKNYLDALQQKINHNASQIDNYLEQRVNILKNAASLLDKAIDLDKDVLTKVAQYRGGGKAENDELRNQVGSQLDQISRSVNIAFEAYPDIKAHKEIADCLQQNSYLQREITAARELYNDSILEWNSAIFQWPTKKIVASKNGYTTRIPFSVSKEVKEEARKDFFANKE